MDSRDRAVIDHFLTAIDAMGGIRAGHQHGLARWFTTGALAAAYLSLAAAQPLPRTGDPVRYWTALVTAGELLVAAPSPDTRLRYALIRCRARAAQAARRD